MPMTYISDPTYTDFDGILSYLEGSSYRWNATQALGTNAVISYSFAEGDTLPTGPGSYGVDDWETFGSAQRDAFRSVTSQIEEFSGLRFVEVDKGGMIDAMIGLNGEGVSGYAYYPNNYGEVTVSSDLVMVYTGFADVGSFSHYVLLHEMGHALGLSHSHTGPETVDDPADNTDNTVMTYNVDSAAPTQYGSFDMAALAHIYGDNSLSSTFAISQIPNGTVVTKGGATDDTIMGVSGRNIIKGLWGDDLIIGRAANDKLYGHGGHDDIQGGAGADRIFSGAGNDRIDGGSGRDWLSGGTGADTFVFRPEFNDEMDVITDFDQGRDVIDLSEYGESFRFSYLTIEHVGAKNNIMIDTSTDRIFLSNSAELTLTADDFVFASDLLIG